MNVEQLVEIMPRLNCDLKEAQRIGRDAGLSRHDVQALRHILGYSAEQIGGKLSAEQKADIVREYEDGDISINKLARKYGVGYNSIYCILKGRNIDTQNPKLWSNIKEIRLIDCIKRGMSQSAIASLLGNSKSAIQRKIERMRAENEKIVDLIKSGKSADEIADEIKRDSILVKKKIEWIRQEGRI